MSWTTKPAIARDFALNRQPDGVHHGQVWVGMFASAQLLAYLGDEREYLVAAAGADVVSWSPGNGRWR
ncbi:hypothetical protein [Pseudonocardia sp. HH130630-07]|uniref:hypothetical protein n=1 Tax=Pseudonocardia sp. HH130630-07 TaxID=1690815 RepID=UPI0012EA2B7E|nr:hypothetical protein [Pseudonocardia sp. HH130630-07]